jgi:hypothetical protein
MSSDFIGQMAENIIFAYGMYRAHIAGQARRGGTELTFSLVTHA